MNRLIVIIGPTASGKSALAMQVARRFDCEIISGDSMCVYKGMDIGTAKPSENDRRLVPHHLIDIREPGENFSVVEFQKAAAAAIEAVNARGRIPVLAGGTGLYVQALLEDYHFSPTARANGMFAEPGQPETAIVDPLILYKRLRLVAPDAAARVHPNDLKRVSRALEIATDGNHSHSVTKAPEPVYDCVVLGLAMDRQTLYRRIDDRVDDMLAAGLVDEVRSLLRKVDPIRSTAFQAIGYKEIVGYLQGRSDLETAVAMIKQSSRRFAKRQLTWFRRMPYVRWIEADPEHDPDLPLDVLCRQVAQKFGIR